MAYIDVTELLSDPDFCDQMIQIKRGSKVNDSGVNVITQQTYCTIGSIQPASGKTLARVPDSLRIEGVSSFWIKGEITTDAQGRYTDILVFRNKRYQVRQVFDWTNFGQGWCEGVCVREVPAIE